MNRSEEIKTNLKQVRDSINAINPAVTLVAVSKTFSAQDVQIAYDAGQRHFGENYVQELIEKAQLLPKDIHWHYIGALQSNKLKLLTKIPGIIIETLDSIDKARMLNNMVDANVTPPTVYLQVNTSGEKQKHGLSADKTLKVAEFVTKQCPRLRLGGLMTIGAAHDNNNQEGENCDFSLLANLQKTLCENLRLNNDLQISMGMSGDYQQAIRQGSTSVRVGSAIFGHRIGKSAL